MPSDEGKNARLPETFSGAVSSPVPPASPSRSISSWAVGSLRCASPASWGTRKPVRYQREGAAVKVSVAWREPTAGPMRSSARTWTSWSRAETGVSCAAMRGGRVHPTIRAGRRRVKR